MSELGARLRMAREEKSLTLDELQNITRIQKRYLSAIEEGNYDALPGKFYARAFIKQYAEAVDLNSDALFDEYKNEIPLAYDEDLPEQLSRVKSRGSVRRNNILMDMFPKILTAVFLLAIAVLIWFLVTTYLGGNKDGPEQSQPPAVGLEQSDDIPGDQSKDEEPSADDEPEDKTEEPAQEEEPPEKPTQEISVAEVKGNTTTYSLKNADKFEVRIQAAVNGECWITMTNNHEKEYLGKMLSNGASETVDLSGEAEAYIRTGSAGNTEIYINEEKLEFSSSPHVQNFIIKLEEEAD